MVKIIKTQYKNTIPTELEKKDFRFIIINKNLKTPKEKGWPDNEDLRYKYNNPKLLKFLELGYNYAIIGGYGRNVILDLDYDKEKNRDEIFEQALKETNTLTVKTPSGGIHLYYTCDKEGLINYKEKGEYRGEKRHYTLGANCVVDKKKYEIIKFVAIQDMTEKQINEVQKKVYGEIKEIIINISDGNKVICSWCNDKDQTLHLNKKDNTGFCFNSDCEISCTYEAYKTQKEGQIDKISIKKNKRGNNHYYIKKQQEIKIIGKFSAFTPYDSVIAFYNIQPFFYDNNKIFWFWDTNTYCYKIVDQTTIANQLEKDLELQGQTFSGKLKTDYIECFKRIGRNNIPIEPEKELLQFKNKIININTLEETEANPKYFFTNPIPYNVGDSEETPVIDSLFKEWVGEAYSKTLYEIIAYCTYRDYPLHRLFCFVGSGSNGKSCFQRIVEKFLGDNCSSSDLDPLMNNRFESSYSLYKKLCCMIGETNFNVLKNTNYLKKATGGDTLRYEIKGKDIFSGVNYAKILISTNSLPMTEDKSEGFYRRWLIIDFPNKFSEQKDILANIPLEEYNNLARKSIKILKELLIKREFTNQGSINDRKQRYEDTSDPLQKFIKEECDQDMNCFTYKYDFKEKFGAYLSANGYRLWSDREISNYMKQKYNDGQKGESKWWAWIGFKFKEKIALRRESNASNESNVNARSKLHTRNGAGVCVTSVTSVTQPREDFFEEIKINENSVDEYTHLSTIIQKYNFGKGVSENTISKHFEGNINKCLEKLKEEGLIIENKPGIWRLNK